MYKLACVRKEHRPPGLEDAEMSLEVVQTSTDMDEVTKGRILSLNSRRLVLDQLKMLAAMLKVTVKETCTQTQQLIEGKLLERGYKPCNAQVLIAQDNGRLYLVNENGVTAAGLEMQGSPGSHVQHDYSYTNA